MPVIKVERLTKVFRSYKRVPGFSGAVRSLFHRETTEHVAVKDVTFEIEEGEFVGFLGPNGAGKTTALKMLAGLLHPTSGDARVMGYVPWERKEAYRRQFALLLGQKNQLWWDLPAEDSFELNAKIYGLDWTLARRRVLELSEMLGVTKQLATMVRELSLGERMKLELIAALLHEPRLLFLDEPTIGLDVVSQKAVRDFLKNHNSSKKTTIMLTSHYMDDIRELCPRVIVIDHGSLFFDGPLEEILHRFSAEKILTLHLRGGNTGRLSQRFSVQGKVLEDQSTLFQIKVPKENAIAIAKELLEEEGVLDIDIEDPPIEEVIREVFSRNRNPS
ncbi:MAG: ATP-binding cassette domain-containing protein [Verrucomicrobia bacterium]|nr:ATP-binding cassette domain-containing protein [Verrucomicrobiota bacterium]